MRPILAFAFLLLAMSTAAPEPDYSQLLRGSLHAGQQHSLTPLVGIESSTGRSDRKPMLILASAEIVDDPSLAKLDAAPPMPLPPNTDLNPDANAPATLNPEADNPPNPDANKPPPAAGDNHPAPQVSLPQLCNALLTAAEDNDLPVAFFANLIWQESRLRDDAVSPKGALGIAQFMPQVAAARGLQNPLDPLQALPASAQLLRTLRDQFRNLGFVAAAYNAGVRRVVNWLEHDRTLPRETRGYVLNVTGRSAEEWRKMPTDDASLHFVRRLPCRELPAFAEIERAQQEAQAAQEQARQPQTEQQDKLQQKAKEPPQVAATARVERKHVATRERVAEREHGAERVTEHGRGRNALPPHPRARLAESERHHPEHEAKQRIHRVVHEGHRRV
jgi:hypothetical protein